MRQTDLYRSGKPPQLLSRNCFELLVKSITAFVTLLASRFLDWVQRARWCTQSRSRHRRPEAEPRHDLDRRPWQLEAAVTAPDYKLYALDTGPPQPGMLRVKTGTGAAIELEVWTLSSSAFGKFVAAVPPPLSVGTIRLADGRSVKGFIVESAAIDGARDISDFGGWRAYVAEAAAV